MRRPRPVARDRRILGIGHARIELDGFVVVFYIDSGLPFAVIRLE